MAQPQPGPRTAAAVNQMQQRIYIRQLVLQVKSAADQILLDQQRGQTVAANGRKLVTLGLSVVEAQAAMKAYEEAAARLARAYEAAVSKARAA